MAQNNSHRIDTYFERTTNVDDINDLPTLLSDRQNSCSSLALYELSNT